MMIWTNKELATSIIDVAHSIGDFTLSKYEDNAALVRYTQIKSTIKTLDDIYEKVQYIQKELSAYDGHTGEYLKGIVTGYEYFLKSLQGDNISYSNLVDKIQQVPIKEIGSDKINRLKELSDKGLTDLGYKGTLAEKIKAWFVDTRIDPEKVVDVAKKFTDKSKEQTLKKVIGLPDEDQLESISSIRGVFWSGFSNYVGNYKGRLTFNIDRHWCEPTFAQVLTHEGYPGHQAFYCRWDYLFKNGKWPLEAALYFINSPTNALFEGGPENALHFIGWDDLTEDTPEISDKNKKDFILARNVMDYQRIFQTNAAFFVNEFGMKKEEAITYMMNNGALGEVEANNCYKFFTHPVQKTYYPCYYYGRWMINNTYNAVPKEQRSEYFKLIYDIPQTSNTLIASVEKLLHKKLDWFE